MEKRIEYLKAFEKALDRPERGKLLRELTQGADEAVEALVSSGDCAPASLDAAEALVLRAERVQQCLQLVRGPAVVLPAPLPAHVVTSWFVLPLPRQLAVRLHRLAVVHAALNDLEAGKPVPMEPESHESAVHVYRAAMTRFTVLHDSAPHRSGPNGVTEREAEGFELNVKEAEAALANALKAAERQVSPRAVGVVRPPLRPCSRARAGT